MSAKNKDRTFLLIIFLFAAAVITRILFWFEYSTIWWDSSVYLGMGKFLFSNGTIGMWELYRPILWAIFMGGIWKIGLDPLIVGKIIVGLFSIGCILLTYLIGKRFSTSTGLIAATLLCFTELFFMFTYIQITDIPSLFFSLLAIYLALKNRYFLAGLAVGIAFNLRFPQALTFAVLLLAILWNYIVEENKKESFKQFLWLCLGSALLVVPYLLYSYYFYGGFFTTLLEAKSVVDLTVIAGRGYAYYFIELLKMNPLLLLAPIGFLAYYYSDNERRPVFTFVLLAAFITTLYYLHEPHKEIRYALAFLPYFCLFAGYGFYMISRNKLAHIGITPERIAAGLIFIGAVTFVGLLVFTTQLTPNRNPVELDQYLSYFADKPGVTVFGPNPHILALSDVKLIRYSYWPRAAETYAQAGKVNYVMVNSCTTSCHEGDDECPGARDAFLQSMNNNTIVFNKTGNNCNLLIYHVQ